MKVPYVSLFKNNADGSISPIQTIRIAGVTFAPGVKLTPGQVVGGIDFTNFKGHDMEVDLQNGVYVITGIY